MTKRIDKEKELKEMHESQASLVNALESIHTLLEESETKLSAARESLEGSRIDNQKHYNLSQSKPLTKSQLKPKMGVSRPAEADVTVPILEDIVVPGTKHDPLPFSHETEIDAELKFTIDEIAEISIARRQTFIDKIEAIQVEMDDYINEALVQCMASIELDLKETLSQKLQELRDIIEK